VYDFTKIVENSVGLAENLLSNSLLTFNGIYDRRTGQAKENYFTGNYRFMKINIYNNRRVEVNGSLHQFYNNSVDNSNTFTLKKVRETINILREDLGINPEKARLHNLELGMNLSLPFNPDLVLDNLIVFGGSSLNKMKVFGKGKGKNIDFTQFSFKAYNKSLQHGLVEDILRIETHISTMENLGLGHVYLNNLSDINIFDHCFDRLTNDFEKLIITEKVTKLSRMNNRFFEQCNNPRKWEVMSAKERFDNRAKFNRLLNKYGTQGLRTTLNHLVKQQREFFLELPLIN
jgi:hypothetical protein